MILILSAIFICFNVGRINGIECLQCSGDYGGIRCSEPCVGDLCLVWKWKTRSELLSLQGCVSGLERRFTAKIGCRTNHLGATMCLCNDDNRCNTIDRAENTILPLPTVRLPLVDCHSKVTGTGIFGARRDHICSANYCHMMKTETYPSGGAPDVVNVYNCADVAEFDFDVRLKSTSGIPGLYANGCYRIQTEPKDSTTVCTCSKNHCNSGIPVVLPGPVRCYLTKGSVNESEVFRDHFCDGDYCFIQKENRRFSKGCISVNERNAWSHLRSGHRHIVGVDQWLCQTHLCNLDVARVTRSYIATRPTAMHSKLLYRNRLSAVYLVILNVLIV